MKSEYINCKNCKDDCRCRGKNITPICVSFTPAKTTNADRIRAMSDAELAKWIAFRTEGIGFDDFEDFEKGWLKWLKEEAKDD